MGLVSLKEDIDTRACELIHPLSTLGPTPKSRSDAERAATIAACRTLLGQITKIAEALSKPDAELAVRLVRAEGRVNDLEQQRLQGAKAYSALAARVTSEARDVRARNIALANENAGLRKQNRELKLAGAADRQRMKDADRQRMKEKVAADRRAAILTRDRKSGAVPKYKRKRGAKITSPKLGGKSVRESRASPRKWKSITQGRPSPGRQLPITS